MKLLAYGKDGGKESPVSGYWLIEAKRLLSVVLLHFGNGTRDAYHDHAFSSISWLLSGELVERHLDGHVDTYRPSLKPIITRTNTFHQVESVGPSWVFSVRGPWQEQWHEFRLRSQKTVTLTSGRREVQ